ncbi:MAG: porin family protein [Rickettsiales bacterium]
MRQIFLAFALMVMAAPIAAEAQQRFPKWYVGLQGSMNFVDDGDVDTSNALIGNTDIEYDNGYGVGIALGYMPAGTGSLLDNMRFELEYGYRKSDVDSVDGITGDGNIHSNTGMLNAYYDFNTGTQWLPYVGAGLGWSQVELKTGRGAVNDDDSVFAWNLMAGVGYAPTSIPNTVWTIGYRYFATEDPDFSITPAFGGGRAETDYDVHNIEAGVRMMF